ncbi:hypothetical protein [Larkinella punicea]|uniref:Uncharacterized protein n=1 Tax=Larkinella punicea TaxID=2315727 RepID=A0A368JUC3_9BACT|nr:hypothetical protein [Larkinella punicea]RCR71270.1 hypothetical protein DUE52_03215 [Larkinella punicea]
MIDNPFAVLERRLNRLESLLLEIKDNCRPTQFQTPNNGPLKPSLSNSEQIMAATGWARSTFYQKVSKMPAGVVIRRGKRLLFNTEKFYEWLQNSGK